LGKSFTCSCLCASAWNSDTVSVLSRERLWVVENLKGRYRNGRNEWMNTAYALVSQIINSNSLPRECSSDKRFMFISLSMWGDGWEASYLNPSDIQCTLSVLIAAGVAGRIWNQEFTKIQAIGDLNAHFTVQHTDHRTIARVLKYKP